mmetsp:Transcript_11235/g.15150  ORF Transcript_11235/g.15150 Transcript_11235/m.15150 type:complete len:83 (-) Transcript_11235:1227-1475(-)
MMLRGRLEVLACFIEGVNLDFFERFVTFPASATVFGARRSNRLRNLLPGILLITLHDSLLVINFFVVRLCRHSATLRPNLDW